MFCGAAASPEASLLFGNYLFSSGLKAVEDHSQHGLPRMIDKAV